MHEWFSLIFLCKITAVLVYSSDFTKKKLKKILKNLCLKSLKICVLNFEPGQKKLILLERESLF